MIRQLAYTSIARHRISEDYLHRLAENAESFNASVGVTGILLCEGRRFMQIIEGSPESVQLCFNRILADRRHDHILKVFDGPADWRSFPDWSMLSRHIGSSTDQHRDFVRAVEADVERVREPAIQAFLIGFALLGCR